MTSLADQIDQAIKNGVTGAITDTEAVWQKVINAGADEAVTQLIGDNTDPGDPINNFLHHIPIVGGILGGAEGDIAGALNPLTYIRDAVGRFPFALGLGYFAGSIAWNLSQPFLRPAIHTAEALAHTQIFDPDTAATLESKRVTGAGFGASEASGGGFNTDRYNALLAGAYAYPATAEALELLRRGIAQPDEVTVTMQRNAIHPDWIEKLKELARNLLSPADLALAYLRTDISEDTLRAYSKQLGVSDDDMNVLIGNTGEPPGPEQLMEALRRNIIKEDRFQRGIRQSRIRDEWIDVETALRFTPMSTADAVRAVVENYLHDDEGHDIALQNGLRDEDWRPLVDSWGRPLSHEQMLTLYHRGKATIDEVTQAFRESDLKDKYTDKAIELGRRLIAERQIVSMLQHGVLRHDDAVTKLHELGFNDDDTNALIALGLAEHNTSAHTLSRANITTLYADGTFNHDTAEQHLETLGYTKENADYLLQIIDLQTHLKELRAETQAVRAQYLAGSIDAAKASTDLIAEGISTDEANHTIEVWNREKRRAARTLSTTQIVKAAKTGTIHADEAINLLVALGYSNADASTLLLSNGVVLA